MATVSGRGSIGEPPSGDGPGPGISPQKPLERSQGELPSLSSNNLIGMITSNGAAPVPGLAYPPRTTTLNTDVETRETEPGHAACPGKDDPEEPLVIDFPFVSRLAKHVDPPPGGRNDRCFKASHLSCANTFENLLLKWTTLGFNEICG